MSYFLNALFVVIGYLLGSIPFALVIGKLFYKTDIRKHGSGNLGGTNAGRVLGKKVGAIVIVFDALKIVLAVMIADAYNPDIAVWAGLATAFGHCYPIFAGFKGGKAVATMFGFLIALSYLLRNPLYFFVPLLCFVIVLKLSKMVSLSSIIAAVISSAQIIITTDSTPMMIASCLFSLLVIFRHRANIKRILDHSESKISWL